METPGLGNIIDMTAVPAAAPAQETKMDEKKADKAEKKAAPKAAKPAPKAAKPAAKAEKKPAAKAPAAKAAKPAAKAPAAKAAKAAKPVKAPVVKAVKAPKAPKIAKKRAPGGHKAQCQVPMELWKQITATAKEKSCQIADVVRDGLFKGLKFKPDAN